MFAGWGIGPTAMDLGRPSAVDLPVPRGVVARPSRLTEVLPVGARSDAETALELARLQPLKVMIAAYEASLVMGLAAHRSDEDADEQGPVPGTSGFFVDELAMVTNSSARAADRLAAESFVLTERLPAVWAAMADGELDAPRARVFVDVLGPTADGVAEKVSVEVLPEAAGLSLGRLRRALIRGGAGGGCRVRRAAAGRGGETG